MTAMQIEKAKKLAAMRFDVATAMRTALDEAKKAYVKAGGDADEWADEEEAIKELVFEEQET